jgi:hypothetical protein
MSCAGIVKTGNLAPRKRQNWTPKKKAAFCEALALGVTVGTAAEAVGMSRSSAYWQRENNPAFAEAWDEAYAESTELLEAEAFQRAMGWQETITDKNGNVRVVERHSDILLMFLLKARKPEYRDSMQVNVDNRRTIVIDLVPMEKGPDGRLRLAEEAKDVPLLSPDEIAVEKTGKLR